MQIALVPAGVAVGRAGEWKDTDGRQRTVLVAISAAFLFLTLLLMGISAAVLRGIADRDAQRAPVFSDSRRGTPSGYYLDTFSTPPMHVVLVQPAGDPAQHPPPGLPRWPGPGEAFVSGEVTRAHPVGSDSPWGRVAGVIGREGLVNLNEQFAYANPSDYLISREHPVVGWGSGSGFAGDHRTNHSVTDFVGLMAVLILLPALLLVHVATGLRSRRLERAVQVCVGLGAPWRFRLVVAAASVLPTLLLLAVMTAVAGVVALSGPDVPVGPLGVIVQGRDLTASVPAVLAAGVVTALTVTASAARHMRPGRRRRAPRFVPQSPRSRSALALVSPVAWVLLPFIIRLDLPLPVLAVLSSLLVVLFLVSAPFWASALIGVIARLWGRFARGPSSLVGARVLRSSTRTVDTIAITLVMSLTLVGVVQLFAGWFQEEVLLGLDGRRAAERRVVSVRAPVDPATTSARVVETLGTSDVVVMPVVLPERATGGGAEGAVQGGEPGEAGETTAHRPTLTVSCEDARTLGVPSCATHLAAPRDLGGHFAGIPASLLPPAVRVVDSTTRTAATTFLVVSRSGQPLDVETLAARGFARQLRVTEIGQDAAGNAATMDHQMRWVRAFLVPGVVAFAAGLILMGQHFLRSKGEECAPLAVLSESRKLPWVVSATGVLAPMLVSVVVGLGAYRILGLRMEDLYEGLHLPAEDTLLMLLVAVTVCLVTWTVLTVTHARRPVTPGGE